MNNKKIKKILLTIIILFLLYIFDFLFCPFHKLTNLYCPGCGVTRMIFSILKLDFYQAFRFNPFLFILSPFFLLYIVDEFLINIFGKKSFFINKISDNVYLFLLILAIIFGVLRNIPMFDYLIPTYV